MSCSLTTEEVLPEAWTDSFARRTRGYDVTTALSRVVDKVAGKINADIVFYDVGPNVGALNRAILLDCDYFITPVAADLFSLRALSTVGRAISKWVRDWETVRSLASDVERPRLLEEDLLIWDISLPLSKLTPDAMRPIHTPNGRVRLPPELETKLSRFSIRSVLSWSKAVASTRSVELSTFIA